MKCPFLLTLAVGVLGCAHRYPLERNAPDFPASLAQVTREVHNKALIVGLQDGRQLVARDLRLTVDSTFWREVHRGSITTIPTAQVERVSFTSTSRSRGAWEGLKTGFQVGAVLGVFIFGIPLFNPDETGEEKMERVGQMISAGVVFAPPGLLVGLVRGSRIIYRFEAEVPPRPPELEESQ